MKYEFRGTKKAIYYETSGDDDFMGEIACNGVAIAAIYINGDTSEHDKNLFLAAPDLLQAAITMLDKLEQYCDMKYAPEAATLRTAIHKALNIEG